MPADYFRPEWPHHTGIQAWQTTRAGGFSEEGFGSLNLAATVGDCPQAVERNRAKLVQDLSLPNEPEWIRLVHGNRALDVAGRTGVEDADATYTNEPGRVLLIPTADCLPVLFVSKNGKEVAAAHAGWRGLSAGILENTLSLFASAPEDVRAWFGPAIGPENFEVGEDVREAFACTHPGSDVAFLPSEKSGKYLADIYLLGKLALNRCGLRKIHGGSFCTFKDERFFSYRRQGSQSGRMASLIWIDTRWNSDV